MTDTVEAKGRTPESLTKLERNWLKRQACGWCEAPAHTNTCYAMVDPTMDLPPRCTDEELNIRREKWLSEGYKPRKPKGDA